MYLPWHTVTRSKRERSEQAHQVAPLLPAGGRHNDYPSCGRLHKRSQNHRMIEKSERTEVNRKDGDISFCPGKIDADDETCTLWAAFSKGSTSQQSGYLGKQGRTHRRSELVSYPTSSCKVWAQPSPPCQRTLPPYTVMFSEVQGSMSILVHVFESRSLVYSDIGLSAA